MRHISVTRNVPHEMRDQIAKELDRAGPVWTAAGVAVSLVERLAEEDPELLAKWLETQAVRIVREAVASMDRAKRLGPRHATHRASVFVKAITAYEESDQDSSHLAAWLDTSFVVSTENHRKNLASMDRDDLTFAASRYTALARTNAMQAAFLRALANEVGARTVGEVFTEQELSRMWQGLDD